MIGGNLIDEKDYRKHLNAAYERVADAFDSVDPDVAEVELGLGSCTILTPKGKIILSPQPPVRQLWLAAASQGIAVHFSWDGSRWVDDKGQGFELYAFLAQVIERAAGLKVKF